MPIAPLPWLDTVIPVGTIQVWSGSIASIPSGWGICDGTSGKPNLLSKFTRGVATPSTDPGSLGGADTVTITSSQIAAHNHSQASYVHSHTMKGNTGAGTGGVRYTNNGDDDDDINTASSDPPNQNLIATGSNGSHENKPPYYEIAYIIKL